MQKPLWFRITLIDCNGQNLAMWAYDEHFPVIAPQFTYRNQEERCPYRIRFDCIGYEEHNLPANMDLNHAIYAAVQHYAQKCRQH